jgi:hypothetical protein
VPNSFAVAAETSSAAAAAIPVVGPAAADLAAAIADLISATFAAAVVINCGSVSKLVIGSSLHDQGRSSVTPTMLYNR